MKQITISIIIFIIIAITAFLFHSGCGIDQNTDQTTPSPTPGNTPESTQGKAIGTVWIDPATKTVDMNEDVNFSLDVYVNSGSQKVAAYGIDITYEDEIILAKSVSAGVDGFIAAANIDEPGFISTSGFDINGKGPGTALHLLIINFEALATGNSPIGVTVNSLTDPETQVIGTPTGEDGNVEIISGK
ncbi:MAG: hypothetical protein JXB88_21855 [Spirochaetales bacterium]|nr:hypothetical protein [Spirochaetales bacterium]